MIDQIPTVPYKRTYEQNSDECERAEYLSDAQEEFYFNMVWPDINIFCRYNIILQIVSKRISVYYQKHGDKDGHCLRDMYRSQNTIVENIHKQDEKK